MTLRTAACLIILLLLSPVPVRPDPQRGGFFPVVAATNHSKGKLTGYLLGGWSPKGWLQDKAAASLLRGQEPYRFYSLTGEMGTAVGSRPFLFQEEGPCPETLAVTFADPPVGQGDLVAVGGPFQALPRQPRLQDTNQQVYKEATAAILRQKGLTHPVIHLTQVMRIDLEGDGLEEVIVSATYYAQGLGPSASPGDYSLVFLRQLVKGKVVTSIITGDYFPQGVKFGAAGEHRVGAVLDLNGDGAMEIILFGRHYEGDWVTAYQIKGGKVIQLFSSGCGV